jgi:hypothetical protein
VIVVQFAISCIYGMNKIFKILWYVAPGVGISRAVKSTLLASKKQAAVL